MQINNIDDEYWMMETPPFMSSKDSCATGDVIAPKKGAATNTSQLHKLNNKLFYAAVVCGCTLVFLYLLHWLPMAQQEQTTPQLSAVAKVKNVSAAKLIVLSEHCVFLPLKEVFVDWKEMKIDVKCKLYFLGGWKHKVAKTTSHSTRHKVSKMFAYRVSVVSVDKTHQYAHTW